MQLLYVCAGADGDMEGGYGFEFVNQIVIALKNYFAKDPQTCLSVVEGQNKTYLQMTYHFIHRCLAINRNSSSGLDGVAIMNLIIAIIENLEGRLGQEFLVLAQICVEELEECNSREKQPKNFKNMILQAICICFYYDSQTMFNFLE